MRVFIGVDLGTSSVKVVALDARGKELAASQVHYPISRPKPQWAEQDPEEWWAATCRAIREVIGEQSSWRVEAVGLSGQMHGLTLVDEAGLVVRPAITWSDARSGEQVARWSARMDPARVEAITGMPIATGMMAASLAWLRDHEPIALLMAKAALLPKDYLRLRLTGSLGIEPTDAAGTLMFDIRRGCPSAEIADVLGLDGDFFPPLGETLSVAGVVTAAAARETGLPAGTPVAFGGSDQAMAALALGLEDERLAAVALSSGGTVVKRTGRPLDQGYGLHVMPFVAPDTWLAMGVVLAAGLAVDWLIGNLFRIGATTKAVSKLMIEAADVPPGADGLIVSPHLGGIRTPRADQSVRANFIGLGYNHGQAHVARAMIEGIGFSLCNSLRLMAEAGEPAREITLSGGAARFPAWRQVIAGIAGMPVRISSDLQHSAIGAAMAGASAVEQPLPSRRDCVEAVVNPEPALVETYARLAERYWAADAFLAEFHNRETTQGVPMTEEGR